MIIEHKMAKEKQETESEIINETDTTTELTVEKQGKELIAQTNLSSSNLIKEFRLSSRGITSDRWRLYYEDFAKIKIELPSLEKQIEIVSRVKNQKNLLDRLKQKTHVISNLKISLLDELLSGQKRVI